MLSFLGKRASERKLRLFALACCRRIWKYMTDERSPAAVEFVERYADAGVAGRKGRPALHKAAKAAWSQAYAKTFQIKHPVEHAAHMAQTVATDAAAVALTPDAMWAAEYAAGFSAIATGWALMAARSTPSREFDQSARQPEEEQQSRLLREIFGNPFRPVALNAASQTSDVVSLARAIYDERAFDRMPILADALEDAGCTNADILEHCRQPAQHVRGCWALDLILGKS
jgi:hypothetical protein